MKNLFKSLICFGMMMSSYAPKMDVRLQYFPENHAVRISDTYDIRSTQKNLAIEDSNRQEWVIRIRKKTIEFLSETSSSLKLEDLPDDEMNEILVPSVLSYLIGNNSLKMNYLNYDNNRKRVIDFFDQVPTDRKKTAEKEMLRWKERVQYEPINGLYQSMTFLNGFRGVTKDGLIAVFLTNIFDYVFPALFMYHSVVFFVGLVFHRHILYLFDLFGGKIANHFEFLVVPRWHLLPKNSFAFSIGNPFYVIFQKPKDIDFDAFNTYLPLMSLCVGADKDEKELSYVKQRIYSHTPNVKFKDFAESFKDDLRHNFKEIGLLLKEESPRGDQIDEEMIIA